MERNSVSIALGIKFLMIYEFYTIFSIFIVSFFFFFTQQCIDVKIILSNPVVKFHKQNT